MGYYVIQKPDIPKEQAELIVDLLGRWFEQAEKEYLFLSDYVEIESNDTLSDEIIQNHDVGRYTILFNASVINLYLKKAIPTDLRDHVALIFKLYNIHYINISLSGLDDIEIVYFMTGDMDRVFTLGVTEGKRI